MLAADASSRRSHAESVINAQPAARPGWCRSHTPRWAIWPNLLRSSGTINASASGLKSSRAASLVGLPARNWAIALCDVAILATYHQTHPISATSTLSELRSSLAFASRRACILHGESRSCVAASHARSAGIPFRMYSRRYDPCPGRTSEADREYRAQPSIHVSAAQSRAEASPRTSAVVKARLAVPNFPCVNASAHLLSIPILHTTAPMKLKVAHARPSGLSLTTTIPVALSMLTSTPVRVVCVHVRHLHTEHALDFQTFLVPESLRARDGRVGIRACSKTSSARSYSVGRVLRSPSITFLCYKISFRSMRTSFPETSPRQWLAAGFAQSKYFVSLGFEWPKHLGVVIHCLSHAVSSCCSPLRLRLCPVH